MRIRIVAVLLLCSLILLLSACNAAPDELEEEKESYTQEAIQKELDARDDVSKITWSADNKKVIYMEETVTAENGSGKIMLWKVAEERARVVQEASQEIEQFTWSPDSRYVLISEKQGEKLISRVVEAQSLVEEEYKIESVSVPVWSPDSLAVVFPNGHADYGEQWGSLEVYTIGEQEREFIWSGKDTSYIVEAWDQEGNIVYTEVREGNETKKTTKNIRPDISGVHLGDTKEEVTAALGSEYTEDPPSFEVGHFPEPAYRWTYKKGFTVFIGEKSGRVLEILATSSDAETNLGVKIGDTAAKVFEVYRPNYIEPESVHGGKLVGIFKVEGAAALAFNFAMDEEEAQQYPRVIKPESKVEMMILTYPSHMDDSF